MIKKPKKSFIIWLGKLPMTVALTGDDEEEAFCRASDLLLHEFEKISGQFAAIGLVRITFPVEEVFTAELGLMRL